MNATTRILPPIEPVKLTVIELTEAEAKMLMNIMAFNISVPSMFTEEGHIKVKDVSDFMSKLFDTLTEVLR